MRGRVRSAPVGAGLEVPYGHRRAAEQQRQHAGVVVQFGVVGRRDQHRLEADQVLGRHLRLHLVDQRGPVGVVGRRQLEPQVPHLVERLLSPAHAHGWRLGIAWILRRVVVDVAHRQRGALRQPQGLRVAIHVLPAEVPGADVDERARRAVGELRGAEHVLRAVVRVGLHGEQRRVDRQRVVVLHDVGAVARWDVDALRPEAEDRRRARGRPVCEVEPDRGLHRFRLPARLHVELHDEVGARIETERQVGVDQRRYLSGGPAEEVAVRILGATRHEAVVAGRRIGVVETT